MGVRVCWAVLWRTALLGLGVVIVAVAVSELWASRLAYALDSMALQDPNVSFWTVREQGQLLGCGALQQLDAVCAEIKSMRTHPDHLRRGVARALLDHLIDEARARGYRQVFLETGSTTPFTPALTLYQNRGFIRCGPFSDYTDNGFNLFMCLDLASVSPA